MIKITKKFFYVAIYIENLFNKIDKDYYKLIKTKVSFNNNYIEYESIGDKDKNLLPEVYLDIIRPYLRDMINNPKAPMKLKYHTDVIIEDDLIGEWKIQLTMQMNFISYLDAREMVQWTQKAITQKLRWVMKHDIIKSFKK